MLDDLPHRRRARVLGYVIKNNAVELAVRVQDFQTYAEMNKKLKAGEEALRTAVVDTP